MIDKWISVEEKFPKSGTVVWIYARNRYGDYEQAIALFNEIRNTSGEVYYSWDCPNCSGYEREFNFTDITHWKEFKFPEPPK